MLVYCEPYMESATLEVTTRNSKRDPVNLSLLTIAVVEDDCLSIRYGVRLRDERCEEGHQVGTSDGCVSPVCALWTEIVKVINLRPVFGPFWEAGSPPPVTLKALAEDFKVIVKFDWIDFRFWEVWDEDSVVQVYTTAHLKHLHILMNVRSTMSDRGWRRIPKMSIGVKIVSENGLYDAALSDRLAEERWLDLPRLSAAFEAVVEELTAVTRVEVYPPLRSS